MDDISTDDLFFPVGSPEEIYESREFKPILQLECMYKLLLDAKIKREIESQIIKPINDITLEDIVSNNIPINNKSQDNKMINLYPFITNYNETMTLIYKIYNTIVNHFNKNQTIKLNNLTYNPIKMDNINIPYHDYVEKFHYFLQNSANNFRNRILRIMDKIKVNEWKC
jgi:hypothetical protein